MKLWTRVLTLLALCATLFAVTPNQGMAASAKTLESGAWLMAEPAIVVKVGNAEGRITEVNVVNQSAVWTAPGKPPKTVSWTVGLYGEVIFSCPPPGPIEFMRLYPGGGAVVYGVIGSWEFRAGS